ncbi:MAG: LPD38 domain-containing protein [Mizugakiibacter sp.]|uniref:LPD38 domain-containing protein n=1 Tax=Mizugakiibacter sp. TaxID=1972610 RepID=UPI003210447F
MAFDIDAARKAGYSDTEIADHLAPSRGFDIAGARKAGYTDGEIAGYLSGVAPKPTAMERVKSLASDAVDNLSNALSTDYSEKPEQASQPAPTLTPAEPTAQDSALYSKVKQANPGASDADIAAKMTEAARSAAPKAAAKPAPDTVKPYDFSTLSSAPKPATPDIPLPTTENVVDSIKAPAPAVGPTVEAWRQQRTAELRQQIPQADDKTISNIVDGEILDGKAGNVGTVGNSNFDFETHQKYQNAGTIERGAAMGVNQLEQSAAGLHQFIGDALGMPGYSEALKEKGDELNREATAIGDRSQYLTRNWEGAVSSIVSQTPGLAVSVLSGGSVPLLMMGLQQFGSDYHDGRAAGLSQDDATKRAAINGVAEIVGEKIGMPSFSKVFRDVTKGAPTEELVKDLAKHILAEVPGEELTTAIEFANDKFPGWGQNKQATLQDYLQQSADTLTQTVMQAGAMGATGVAGNAARARQEQSATVAADVSRDRALNAWDQAFKKPGDQGAQPAAPAPSRLDQIRQQVADRKQALRADLGMPAHPTPAAPLGTGDEPADSLDQDQLLADVNAAGGEPVQEAATAEPQPTPAAIDEAAHEAATSPKNDLPEPTEAQKEAGNYQKGHVTLHGLDISIENPAGSTRSGTDEDGKPWETTLANHYGYVKRTTGADGDQVDVFIGDKPESQKVYVVDQINPKTGAFDEHKAMLGFDDPTHAWLAYHANYDKGWTGAKNITEMSVDQFKGWLKNGDTSKPVAKEEHAAPTQQVAAQESPTQGTQGEAGGLSIGTTPNNAEPISVRNGIVHIGKYPAQHFETGEDVAVPPGADHAAVAQALRDSGAVGGRQRIYGLPKQEAQPKPSRAQQIKQQVKARVETSDEMAARTRRQFIAAIKAMGGINVTEAKDVSGEPAHIANRMAPGLFRKQGNALDLVARRLHELGYLSDAHYNDVDGGVQAVRDMVGQALSGEPVMTTEEADRYAELSAREQQQAEGMPAPDDALADMIVAEVDDADLPDLDAPAAMSEADAMRAMGFTEDEINEATATQGQHREAPEGSSAGAPQEGAATGAHAPADAGFALEGQTPEQLTRAEQIAKEAAAAKAKKEADADAKAKADSERDSFSLTGSDRAADANPGQGDIFSQPASKTIPQSESTAPEHAAVGVDDRELGQIVKEFNSAQRATVEDGEKITHVFDAPAKGEIVRLNDKVKVYHKEHGWMTVDEARAKIAEWKDHAAKQGAGRNSYENGNSQRVVLSLFDLTGKWSKPWEEAGYQVYRFDIQNNEMNEVGGETVNIGDINNFSTELFNDVYGSFDGMDIYAILAACPCTDFAVSGARHFAAKDADGRTVASVKLVHQTLATIEHFKPAVWAIENPVGRIEELGGLPPWRLSFDPNHLGDPYTKKTLLWGRFNADLPIAPVEPTEGSKMHSQYGGKSLATKNARSATPEGFAYGFFMANNAVDHPAMAIANKYDRLDRSLIERAVKAGVTEQQIDNAVEDFYYQDLDDEAASEAIRALIPAESNRGKLAQAMNDLADTRAKIEQQGRVVDDRLLERERRQKAIVKELEAEQKPAVSANTIVTEDAAAAARALLKRKLGGQLNSGIDPEVMQAGITLAIYHVERGARTFSAYTRAMLEDLGDAVKPYLKSWYVAVKFDPRASGFSAEMDGMADVEKADIEKESAGELEVKKPDATATFIDDRWATASPDERKAMIERAGRADIADIYKDVAWKDLSDNMRASLAHAMNESARPAEKKPITPQVAPVDLTKSGHWHSGNKAFKEGQPRVLPSYFTNVTSSNAKDWYRGWDAANAEAPVESVAPAAEYTQVEKVVGDKLETNLPEVEHVTGKGKTLAGVVSNTLTKDQAAAVDKFTFKKDGGYFIRMKHVVRPGAAEPSRVGAIASEVKSARTEVKPGDTLRYNGDRETWLGGRILVKPGELVQVVGYGADKYHYNLSNGWQIEHAAVRGGNWALVEPSATLNSEVNHDAEHARIPEQARPEAGDGEADRGAGRGGEPGGRPLGSGMAEADTRAGEVGGTAGRGEAAGGTGTAGSGVRAGESVGGRDREPATDGNGPESTSPRAKPVALPSEPKADFTVDDETADAIEEGGQKTKARNNIAAIKLVKKLAAEDRRATIDEQKVLAKYVGWGGIKQLFDEDKGDWSALRDELKNLLTADEYAAARRSILDAHYTSLDVTAGMWAAARHLGFNGGRVLEPSVGVGNFFGAMPHDLRANSGLYGVELDNITGQIAKYLYPNATIATPAGFQDVELPSNSFDFATGNPPFGEQSLFDPSHPEFRSFSIHQFFFAKALDKVRPGGILQMVVSRYLMDSRDAAGFAAREYLAKHARLLGAIRLPYNAFLGNANTEVVTDIIALQKLEDGEIGNPEAWTDMADVETVHPKTGEKFSFPINRYFVDHPEMVAGTHAPTGKMRQANQYNVEPPSEPLAMALGKAVTNLPRDVYQAATKPLAELATADAVVPEGTKVYGYYLDNGAVMQRLPDAVGNRQARAVEFKDSMAPKRAARMIEIRDTLRSLMRAELSEDSTDAEIAGLRAELNRQYDAFQKQYGYINQPANRRALADDPDLPLLESLEPKFDPGLGTEAAKKRGEPARKPSAEKADIFKKRVLQPMHEVKSVTSGKDALVVSLNERGRIDPEHMAEIYGTPWEDIRRELGDLIYLNPNGDWETADAYLSGNVKAKLKQAQAAAAKDPQFAANVTALEAVQPPDVPALKISVRLGSPWVPPEDMARFAGELFGAKNPSIRYVKQVAKWSVSVPSGDETARRATWGTNRVPAEDILEHILNNKPIVVKDNRGDSRNPDWVVNEPATEAARAKAQDMATRFREWIWQDPERRGRLERIYNDNYNTDVRRKYDGSHLTLPGSNPAIKLRPHQKAAVWRAIQDRTILLDHVVGAGKTFEKAAIAMELRRLGIARKPMFMVPNSLVRQWRDEFYKLYPNANVLAATEADFTKANRRRFMAKIATGDWDAVIVAHSSFKKIGMPADTEKAILSEQLNDIADAIEEMKRERGDRNVMRDMERMKEKIAERLKGLAAKGGKKDDTVTFDELGTDAVLLDEAHLFKNLFYTSGMRNVAGLGNPSGSGRAFDLFVKLRYLDQRYAGKAPVVFATGTPVSNSLVEMFTMQRYLAWNKLKDAGLHLLDAWAGVYGDVQNVYEVHPSGTGYRLSTRFAKFVNLPSLMDLYRSFADVVTMDDLKAQAKEAGTVFPVPKIKGGRPQNVVADRSDLQSRFFGVPEFVRSHEAGDIVFELPGYPQDYSIKQDDAGKFKIAGPSSNGKTYETWDEANEDMTRLLQTPKTQWNQGSILWKFENLKQLNKDSKGKINALSITNEARKAGLDFRLIDPNAPDFAGSKVNQAVTNALRIHKQWADDRGAQLIFCDLSVPQSARAAAASKEREAFVRREDGTLEKVKATVATLDGVERAFLVVKRGAKENASFTVYDGQTGADLGIEEGSRAEAVKALAHAFENDLNMADKLEQFQPIDDAEIADWKDANEKEAAEDDSEADDSITVSELVGLSGGGKFSVYDDIKAKLIAGGVPENEIAFIHDYDTAAKKNDLFKKVNAGDIRILLGSTEKMGAGMNVQERLVGLHHLDAPWRPSDLEQREGRIVRQGNSLYLRDPDGFEVEILRYGTRQTYDTRMWQIIEHKAAGVEQLRKASDDLLEIDDVGGEAANAADMKAAASGNPLILEEIKLRNEVKSLEAQQYGHLQAKVSLQDRAALYRRAPERMRTQLAEILPFKDAAEANPVKPFAYTTPSGKTVDDPKGATTPVSEAFVLAAKGHSGDRVKAGQYRGMGIEFYRVLGAVAVNLTKDGQSLWVASYEMEDKFSPSGLFTRLDNAVSRLDERERDIRAEADRRLAEIPKLEAEVDKPFAKEAELKAARQKHRETVQKLAKAGGGVELSPEMKAELKLALVQRMIEWRNQKAGDALFGFSESAGGFTPILQRELDHVINRVASRWERPKGFEGGRITAVDTPAGLPVTILRAAAAQNIPQEEIKGVLHHGHVYLVRENLKDATDAEMTIFHEAYGHLGARLYFGPDAMAVEKAMLSIWKRVGDLDGVRKMAERFGVLRDVEPYIQALAKAETLSQIQKQKIIVDELLAHVAGQGDFTFAEQLKAYAGALRVALRNAAKAIGLDRVAAALGKYTDGELLWNLKGMRDAIVSGKTGKGEGTLFARVGPPAAPPNRPTQPKQTPPPGGVSASVPDETRFRKAQRIYQDQFNRFTVIQEWLRDNGVKLGNKHDVYRAEERMYGKIAGQIEDFRAQRLQPLIVKIHKSGFNMGQVGEYLVANHAAERNAQIAKINPDAVDEHGNPNGSGMTDAEAQAVLNRYASLPDAAAFEKLAEEFRSITDDTKRILLDAGIISKEMADAWDAAYQHYVPLRGGPAEPGMGQATGKGLSVNGRGERLRAMGHKARDEWVVENIIHAHERAIYLAEKNRVGQHLVSLAAAAPDQRLWTIDKPVKRKVLRPGQATYIVNHQGAMVGAFDTRKEADLFITSMVTSANKTPSDFTVTKTVGDPQVAYMASGSMADNEVQIYVKGNTVRIQLNDPLLARAYKKMGQTHLVGVLELGRQVNAFLSKAYTGINPEFIVSNVQRDLISGLMNVTGEEGASIAAKTIKNWLPSLRDMLRYSMKGEASPWVAAYREDGGNTGAAYLSDLERISKDVQTAFDEAVGARQLFAENKPGKATRVALKKSLHLVTAWIEHMNAAAENGMRVALYRSMVEAGKGRAAAAAAAKNSTVNFNRKGEIGSQLSALYLFANPSIQGAASMGHALFKGKHKGQAWVMMGALAGLAYMLALGYGDDDEWDEVPQYEKDHNLLIRIGDKVVKIAVPYGQGVAFALGNAIYDLQRGKDPVEESYHMASSLLENLAPLNPLGDKPDLKFALTELIPFEPLRIFGRVANNTTGFQGQIMPESKFDEARPDFLKEYRNTHGTVYDQITRGMSKATGGTATQAGAVDVSPETLKFLWESATGGTGRFFIDSVQAARMAAEGILPEVKEIPIARKFVRDANRPADARTRFWDSINRAETVLQDYHRAVKGKDYAAVGHFEGMELGGLSKVVASYKDVSIQARDAVAAINAMDNKTAAEKRLMTFEVEKRERELYRAMVKDLNRRIGEK